MKEKVAENINILGKFCGKRDLSALVPSQLKSKYGLEQVDVMVLFGGSILAGGDVMAEAMKNKIAKKYIIVGGLGHTTEALREKIHTEYPEIETKEEPEARLFASYLKHKYNLQPDFLECKSTNCGNNITYLLDLLKKNNISFKSIIISQDATMQNRMDAGLRKYISKDKTIINYAVYDVEVIEGENDFYFNQDILGMWNIERYITLLMGEIPRLLDDINGYGPRGMNFIAHVDIPSVVMDAFIELNKDYSSLIREANPLYSS